MTKIKICGLRSGELLKSIKHLPVDYWGFIFAESKRQVTPAHVQEMINDVTADSGSIPGIVGVFVNPTISGLTDVFQHVKLDVIQLHGEETPDFCNQVKQQFQVKIFKSVSVRSGQEPDRIIHDIERYQGYLDAILLDTFVEGTSGGSGKTFEWRILTEVNRWACTHELPLFTAGGLNPDNVTELIEQYLPHGVDVSSGVETNGQKDIEKIRTFVERVSRAYEQNTSG